MIKGPPPKFHGTRDNLQAGGHLANLGHRVPQTLRAVPEFVSKRRV
jgi:hypothetical protein